MPDPRKQPNSCRKVNLKDHAFKFAVLVPLWPVAASGMWGWGYLLYCCMNQSINRFKTPLRWTP